VTGVELRHGTIERVARQTNGVSGVIIDLSWRKLRLHKTCVSFTVTQHSTET